jgi:hypothetical protein
MLQFNAPRASSVSNPSHQREPKRQLEHIRSVAVPETNPLNQLQRLERATAVGLALTAHASMAD